MLAETRIVSHKLWLRVRIPEILVSNHVDTSKINQIDDSSTKDIYLMSFADLVS